MLFAFSLKAVILKFSQFNLIWLFKTVSLLHRIFLPTFVFEVLVIWKVSCLALKFCWKFMSLQSSLELKSLYILYSWIASLYFAKFIGVARFSRLCKFVYEVLRSVTLFNNFRAFAAWRYLWMFPQMVTSRYFPGFAFALHYCQLSGII